VGRRAAHPNKHVEAALKYVESRGWIVEKSEGGAAHAWGAVMCPYNRKSCRCGVFCRLSVWGTPRNPESLARKIRSAVDKCTEAKKQQVRVERQEQ